MIHLHRLNGQEIVVNADLIESVEGHPDTVIMLASNNRFVVQESVEEVIERVVAYRKAIQSEGPYLPGFLRGERSAKGGRTCH